MWNWMFCNCHYCDTWWCWFHFILWANSKFINVSWKWYRKNRQEIFVTVILVTFFCCTGVFNQSIILNRSLTFDWWNLWWNLWPTHSVSKMRHQHRCYQKYFSFWNSTRKPTTCFRLLLEHGILEILSSSKIGCQVTYLTSFDSV